MFAEVLHLKESIKPLYEESVTLLSTTKEAPGCCQSRQNSRGVQYASEDKISKNVIQYSSPRE